MTFDGYGVWTENKYVYKVELVLFLGDKFKNSESFSAFRIYPMLSRTDSTISRTAQSLKLYQLIVVSFVSEASCLFWSMSLA